MTFVSALTNTLKHNLLGVYLYGSLATGEFVEGQSDVDLLMLLNQDIDHNTLNTLVDFHRRFGSEHRPWQKLLDVAYVARAALWSFQSEPYEAIVSDARDLLTLVDAPHYYLIDWFTVQEHGTVLSGPQVVQVMPKISVGDFTQTVFDYMQSFPDAVTRVDKPGEQAYVIVTMCRSLYAYKLATHVSKNVGAMWAMKQYPQWRELIQKALDWSRNEGMGEVVDEDDKKATIELVNFMVNEATK